MERRAAEKSSLLVLLVLSCLFVVPLVSSVPMPRSLRLGSQQQDPPALRLTSSQKQEMAIAAAIKLGKPTARMDVEVNDYPPPGANDHHDPGHGSEEVERELDTMIVHLYQ